MLQFDLIFIILVLINILITFHRNCILNINIKLFSLSYFKRISALYLNRYIFKCYNLI